MLTAVWHMFTNGALYEDLGADHFVRRDKDKAARNLAKRANFSDLRSR